jgi:hypothetical protein
LLSAPAKAAIALGGSETVEMPDIRPAIQITEARQEGRERYQLLIFFDQFLDIYAALDRVEQAPRDLQIRLRASCGSREVCVV